MKKKSAKKDKLKAVHTSISIMDARKTAKNGLNDIRIKKELSEKPCTKEEFKKQYCNKAAHDIINRIEFAKYELRAFISLSLSKPYSLEKISEPSRMMKCSEILEKHKGDINKFMNDPEVYSLHGITDENRKKNELFKAGQYGVLNKDNDIDDFTKEAIEIYEDMERLNRKFIESEYEIDLNLLDSFINYFENFGFWRARVKLLNSKRTGYSNIENLKVNLDNTDETKKKGDATKKRMIQHLKKFYILNPDASKKEAKYSIHESLGLSIHTAKKHFTYCMKLLK